MTKSERDLQFYKNAKFKYHQMELFEKPKDQYKALRSAVRFVLRLEKLHPGYARKSNITIFRKLVGMEETRLRNKTIIEQVVK